MGHDTYFSDFFLPGVSQSEEKKRRDFFANFKKFKKYFPLGKLLGMNESGVIVDIHAWPEIPELDSESKKFIKNFYRYIQKDSSCFEDYFSDPELVYDISAGYGKDILDNVLYRFDGLLNPDSGEYNKVVEQFDKCDPKGEAKFPRIDQNTFKSRDSAYKFMVLFRLAHRAMMGFIDYEPEGSSCYDNEDIFEAVDKLNNKISGLVDRYIVRGDTYFARETVDGDIQQCSQLFDYPYSSSWANVANKDLLRKMLSKSLRALSRMFLLSSLFTVW